MSGTRTQAARATGIAATLIAAALVIAGCAPRQRADDGPTADAVAYPGREWRCEPQDVSTADRLAGRTEEWTVEGGSMVSAHRTRELGAAPPGRPTRDEAIADAISSAADAALDLLAIRGISYDPERRDAIVEEATRAAVRGADVAFPRVGVVARSWDECVAGAEGSEAGADTTWRASVLVEYPIGLLRGDVRNVTWERERAANEAGVLMASAEEHLASGRWHAGLLDAARAAHVVRETGALLWSSSDSAASHSVVAEQLGRTGPTQSSSADNRLRGLLSASRAAGEGALPVLAQPVGGVDVIESGASSELEVQFHCSYEWEGRSVPAIAVPVRFEMPGASAVLDAEPVTDTTGAAICRVVTAYGPAGEYELKLYLDVEAARVALEGTDASPDESLALARHSVHVVTGAHAVSVCATFGESTDADAAQVAAGFARRMERDGFRMGDCGPNVDVVVTGEFSLSTVAAPDSWTVEVVLTASAFDQRTARELGETSVRATQTSSAESGEDGRRDAEVLALKEAGRLMAVYFEPRILSSEK
jgi:hypothetical protein